MAEPEEEILRLVQEKMGTPKPKKTLQPPKLPKLDLKNLDINALLSDKRILAGVAVLILLLLAGAWFLLFSGKTYTFTFTDPEGNPLSGVKVTFSVDGKTVEKVTGPDGVITLRGNDVTVETVEYPGYPRTSVRQTGENEFTIILAPDVKSVTVEIRSGRSYLSALLKVYVNGEEVFSDTVKKKRLCFTSVKYKDCFVVKKDDEVKFVASKEGYKGAEESFKASELPTRVRLELKKEESREERESETVQRTADVFFTVRYDNSQEPVNGYLSIAPIGSLGSGKTVTIRSGQGYIRLPVGRYKVTSVEVQVGGKVIATDIVSGGTFTVSAPKTTAEIVVKKPKTGFPITFKITDEEGKPLPATVLLKIMGQKLKRTAGESGVVEFQLKKPGCGEYSVTAEGYESATGRACTGKVISVTLKRYVAKGTVIVHVFDVREQPLKGASVTLYDENGFETSFFGETNEEGIVEFNDVPAGRYLAEAVFDAVSDISDVFEVKDKEKTDVYIYLAPSKASLTISIREGNLPVPGATVTVFDSRGRKLLETTTDFQGKASGEVPTYIPIFIWVKYKEEGVDYHQRFGPYSIPPNVEEYELNIELTPLEDGTSRFIGLKNSSGELVGSVKKNEYYWMVFRVAHKDEASFTVEANGVEFDETIPEGEVNDGLATLQLSPAGGVTVEDVMVKMRVPLSYVKDVIEVKYGVGEKRTAYIPVGFEMTCYNYVCANIEILDPETGDIISPRDTLRVDKEYDVTVRVFSRLLKDPIYVEVIRTAYQTQERVVEASGTLMPNALKVFKFVLPKASDPQAILFSLRVKATPQEIRPLEEPILGVWSIYVPEFGDLPIKDYILFANGVKLPQDYFLPYDSVAQVLRIKLSSQPKVPINVTAECDDLQIFGEVFSGKSFDVTLTNKVTGCNSLIVRLEGIGYNVTEMLFSPIKREMYQLFADPVQFYSEGASELVLTISAPSFEGYEYNFHALVSSDCNAGLLTEYPVIREQDGTYVATLQLYWDGRTCVGEKRPLDIMISPVLVKKDTLREINLPFTLETFTEATFGSILNCVRFRPTLEVRDGIVEYNVHVEISCKVSKENPIYLTVLEPVVDGCEGFLDPTDYTLETSFEYDDVTNTIAIDRNGYMLFSFPLYNFSIRDYCTVRMNVPVIVQRGKTGAQESTMLGEAKRNIYGSEVESASIRLLSYDVMENGVKLYFEGSNIEGLSVLIKGEYLQGMLEDIPSNNFSLTVRGSKLSPRTTSLVAVIYFIYGDGTQKEINSTSFDIDLLNSVSLVAGNGTIRGDGTFYDRLLFKVLLEGDSGCTMRPLLLSGWELRRGFEPLVLCDECTSSLVETLGLYVYNKKEYEQVTSETFSPSCTVSPVETSYALLPENVFYEAYSFDITLELNTFTSVFKGEKYDVHDLITNYEKDWFARKRIGDAFELATLIAAAPFAGVCDSITGSCGGVDAQTDFNSFKENLSAFDEGKGEIVLESGLVLPLTTLAGGISASTCEESPACYSFTFEPSDAPTYVNIRVEVNAPVPSYVKGPLRLKVFFDEANNTIILRDVNEKHEAPEGGALFDLNRIVSIDYGAYLRAILLGRTPEVPTVFYIEKNGDKTWAETVKGSTWYIYRKSDTGIEENYAEEKPAGCEAIEGNCDAIFGTIRSFAGLGYYVGEASSSELVYSKRLERPCDEVSISSDFSAWRLRLACGNIEWNVSFDVLNSGWKLFSHEEEGITYQKSVYLYRYSNYWDGDVNEVLGWKNNSSAYGVEAGCVVKESRSGREHYFFVQESTIKEDLEGNKWRCVKVDNEFSWFEIGKASIEHEFVDLNILTARCIYTPSETNQIAREIRFTCGESTVQCENNNECDLNVIVTSASALTCTCEVTLPNGTLPPVQETIEIFRVEKALLGEYNKLVSVDGRDIVLTNNIRTVSGYFDEKTCLLGGYPAPYDVSVVSHGEDRVGGTLYTCEDNRWSKTAYKMLVLHNFSTQNEYNYVYVDVECPEGMQPGRKALNDRNTLYYCASSEGIVGVEVNSRAYKYNNYLFISNEGNRIFALLRGDGFAPGCPLWNGVLLDFNYGPVKCTDGSVSGFCICTENEGVYSWEFSAIGLSFSTDVNQVTGSPELNVVCQYPGSDASSMSLFVNGEGLENGQCNVSDAGTVCSWSLTFSSGGEMKFDCVVTRSTGETLSTTATKTVYLYSNFVKNENDANVIVSLQGSGSGAGCPVVLGTEVSFVPEGAQLQGCISSTTGCTGTCTCQYNATGYSYSWDFSQSQECTEPEIREWNDIEGGVIYVECTTQDATNITLTCQKNDGTELTSSCDDSTSCRMSILGSDYNLGEWSCTCSANGVETSTSFAIWKSTIYLFDYDYYFSGYPDECYPSTSPNYEYACTTTVEGNTYYLLPVGQVSCLLRSIQGTWTVVGSGNQAYLTDSGITLTCSGGNFFSLWSG